MTMKKKGKRIGIIGAGPAGLTAGIIFKQAGYDVKIFDKAPEIVALGGGIILSAPVLIMLREIGIKIDDIYAAGDSEFRRADGRLRVHMSLKPELQKKTGTKGWQAGMMRSNLYQRFLDKVKPMNILVPNHEFVSYIDNDDSVTLNFVGQESEEVDFLLGADGIHSRVRRQLWGAEENKKLRIVVYLAWSEPLTFKPEKLGIYHDKHYQTGWAPCIHQGRRVVEWWHVQRHEEGEMPMKNPLPIIAKRVNSWAKPIPEIVNATKPENIFPWIPEGLRPLKKWSKGRITIAGDAAHPTSPYSAYGAGMAIEDSYYLANYLIKADLTNNNEISEALDIYEKLRIDYTNEFVEMAKKMGYVFHTSSAIGRTIRDFLIDHTPLFRIMFKKAYMGEVQSQLKALFDTLENK